MQLLHPIVSFTKRTHQNKTLVAIVWPWLALCMCQNIHMSNFNPLLKGRPEFVYHHHHYFHQLFNSCSSLIHHFSCTDYNMPSLTNLCFVTFIAGSPRTTKVQMPQCPTICNAHIEITLKSPMYIKFQHNFNHLNDNPCILHKYDQIPKSFFLHQVPIELNHLNNNPSIVHKYVQIPESFSTLI